MASSPLNSKVSFHSRSNSFPSKPHPIINRVDEHLCRLRSSEQTGSSSSYSIFHRLSTLLGLHDCIDNLLLKLWDLYDIAKDILSQTKECARELLSSLRMRKVDEMGILSELQKCLNARKMMKKRIHKTMEGTEIYRNVEKNHETRATVGLLREVEEVTFSTVESLLSSIFGTKSESKLGKWSLVSKLVHTKRVCDDKETNGNEFEVLDAVTGQRISKFENMQILGKIESNIEDLEGLYRRLFKTRVSLLNIFNH